MDTMNITVLESLYKTPQLMSVNVTQVLHSKKN